MSLVFNGTTITTWYHLAARESCAPNIREIAIPNTLATSRSRLVLGARNGGGLKLTFSEEGVHRNRVISTANRAAVVTIQTSLETWAKAGTVATLTYSDGSATVTETDMMIIPESLRFGALEYSPTPVLWHMPFSVSFVKIPD